MSQPKYTVQAVFAVQKDLKDIKDPTTLQQVHQALQALETNPHGKPLSHHPGYFSVRCGRSRYRLLFRVNHQTRVVTVTVVAKRQAGHRTDVYEMAKRRL